MNEKVIKLADVQKDPVVSAMVEQANACLETMGYTDHGPRHVGYVARITGSILKNLGYPDRTVELGAIAGWTHDVGNMINRHGHAQSGATLLFSVLRDIGMPTHEVLRVCSAVGNHDESSGRPVSEISAALIIADKVDAHRARVRRGRYDFSDIHDRVNYAIRHTDVSVDAKARVIRFACKMDNTSSVREFMQIYMTRLCLAEEAAAFLGCRLEFVVNDMLLNNAPTPPGNIPEPPEDID
ncbi:MAG: HD domain-containing protein [Clostridia bacterium]|nr:HD domain-containing protein [Clostridia bacterium]